jgi:hypothetical protein
MGEEHPLRSLEVAVHREEPRFVERRPAGWRSARSATRKTGDLLGSAGAASRRARVLSLAIRLVTD